MVKNLLPTYLCYSILFILFTITNKIVKAQCGFSPMKQQMVKGLSIGPTAYFTGLLQWLPSDYNINTTKRYPVIIYFGGQQANGAGDSTGLCKLIGDSPTDLPAKIENNSVPNSYTVNGNTYSYIFISAQFVHYIGGEEHRSDDVDALINYVLAHYRVDSSRVYLTGMSAGSNLVMDYVASSVTHAHRIAAATMASLCYDTTFNPSGPFTVYQANLPLWLVHCTSDSPCTISIPDNWVNKINGFHPVPAPVYNKLPPGPPFDLNHCNQFFGHDTWESLFDTSYRAASGHNMYEFNLQFDRADILPIALKSFTARLADGKVYLRWVTADEQGNTSFILQRAGSNQQYAALATFKGTNLAGENIYEYTDNNPLSDLSYYRIQETGPDGKQQYFPSRRVLYKTVVSKQAIISPNPFNSELSAFISLNGSQKLAISLTDMNGKILVNMNGLYPGGTSEISIPVTGLARGVYFLKISNESNSEVHKVIKQ